MQTRVKIGREYKTYDLNRCRAVCELKLRDKVIVVHSVTGSLCIAKVVERRENSILVREITKDIVPHQWRIYKGNLFRGVFKIN